MFIIRILGGCLRELDQLGILLRDRGSPLHRLDLHTFINLNIKYNQKRIYTLIKQSKYKQVHGIMLERNTHRHAHEEHTDLKFTIKNNRFLAFYSCVIRSPLQIGIARNLSSIVSHFSSHRKAKRLKIKKQSDHDCEEFLMLAFGRFGDLWGMVSSHRNDGPQSIVASNFFESNVRFSIT